MKFKAFVYLSIFLFSSALRAETKYILIDPGTSPRSNYYRYYNAVRRAYETILSSTGSKPTVYAKNQKWTLSQAHNEQLLKYNFDKDSPDYSANKENKNIDYPPISGPAGTVEDFVGSIKKLNLKDGDSVVFYITSHGGSPSDMNKPETATISGWKSDISYGDFGEALKSLPSGVKIKLITTTCFGGGVHSIARSLPNVCSSAMAPYLYVSNSGLYQEDLFSIGLWEKFRDTKGKTSFAEMNLNGFAFDYANKDMGRLSSFDYIDFILKKGVYDPKFSRTRLTNKDENIPEALKYARTPDLVTVASLPKDYSTSLPPDASVYKKPSSSLESGTCPNCCSGGVQSDLDKLTKLAQTLSEFAQQAVVQDLNKKADRQPAQVRTVFHDVIDDMKKNGAGYLKTAQMYEDKYKDLVRRWDEHKTKFKNAGAISKRWQGEGEARANIQKEFDTLKSNADRDLKQYAFNHQMLERLGRLDEFNKKSTLEQKKKFVQLLQCEWEPL